MADNNPNLPGGAVPPGGSKKETVRINLPPKPTAAPTIKLPTLPPGGPSAPGAPLPTAMRPAAAPAAAAAPASAQRPVQRPLPPAVAVISPLDKILAIAAAVAAIFAVGTSIYCMSLFTNG